MTRETEQLRFVTEHGKVWLYQTAPPLDEQCITLSRDQIVQMIEWLRMAKEEFEGASSTA